MSLVELYLFLLAEGTNPPTIESVKDTATLNTWLMSALFALGAAGFAYLLSSIRDKETGKDKAVDKMVQIMQDVIKKSDDRHDKQVSEHDRDRDAFLTSTGEIKNAIVESAKVSTAVVTQLESLREEIKRSGERRTTN